jgi:hypothetical protein
MLIVVMLGILLALGLSYLGYVRHLDRKFKSMTEDWKLGKQQAR